MRDERPDEELAGAARAGDEAAYAALVRRLVRPAFAVAWEFTNDADDAEDVVQEAFHRTVRALGRYDPSRRFRPWFFTILRNAARNHLVARDRWITEPVVDLLPGPAVDPLEALEQDEVWQWVAAGMETLSPMQRACFRLIDLEGMSGVEVSESLGIAEGTVRVHLYRARQVLRGFLNPVKEGRLPG